MMLVVRLLPMTTTTTAMMIAYGNSSPLEVVHTDSILVSGQFTAGDE